MDFLRQRLPGAGRNLVRILLLGACAGLAHGQSGNEYEIKAAFLYRFASFVEWPGGARLASIGICVIGQDPFGESLDKVVKGKAVNGKEFLVRRLRSLEALSGCHILFVSSSERNRLKPLLDRLQGGGVLTVGDVPGFCESGGVVNFDVVDQRVRLEINPAAAERAGLQLSSRLLSLARIVREGPGGNRGSQ